jgi:putative transposase
MGTSCLEQNAIVEIDGKQHRLHRKITDTCWQLEELKTGQLVTKEHHELLQMVAKLQLTFPARIPASKRGLEDPLVPEIAKLRRTYVMAVLDVPNSRKQMEPAINDVWKRVKQPTKPPGWISVYRWKTRFLQSKNDIRVLTDNASDKGDRTSRYSPEKVGHRMRKAGLITRRLGAAGNGLLMDLATRTLLHEVAGAYGCVGLTNGNENLHCPLCQQNK